MFRDSLVDFLRWLDAWTQPWGPGFDVLQSVVITIVSAALGYLLTEVFNVYVKDSKWNSLLNRGKNRNDTVEQNVSYSEQLEKLVAELQRAGVRIDRIMQEMTSVAQQREQALKQIESQLSTSSAEEAELKQRVEALRAVKPEVAQIFAAEVERLGAKAETRSKWRDYVLFVLGVIGGGVVSILLDLYKQA